MIHRPRRLRKNPVIREMVAETQLSKDMFIYPYFVVNGKKIIEPIEAMPGIFRYSIDTLLNDVEAGLKLGINKILLFGVGEKKSNEAQSAYDPHTIVADAVRALKKKFGDDLIVITDVCLCAYTTHGHCGLLENDIVLNDPSLEVIAKMALTHAEAGADMVAPSDMMDGRVRAIRTKLDENGFDTTSIMSYATKFASAYYGPFREAAESTPQFGDRRSYQMNPANAEEAMREVALDIQEGADMVMVKPALAYLDILHRVKTEFGYPTAAYSVSAEYSMIKAAAAKGWIDERAVTMESLLAMRRAGADILITYAAADVARWLRG